MCEESTQSFKLDTCLLASRSASVLPGNPEPPGRACGEQGPLRTGERTSLTNGLKSECAGGRLIFNLGHGIQPETPIAHVEQMVKRVRGYQG